MKHRPIRWILAAAVLATAGTAWFTRTPREEAVAVLDPARIVLLRTPGGFLEVGALEKVEEFGWSTRYTCPFIDCPQLLAPTISHIRVRARFVYRIPLAAEWKLVPRAGHYELTVPEPQLQVPVGFHTQDMQIQTTERGWLSPPAAPNREAVVRHLGPELARRGAEPAYLQAQRANAQKTVAEFARKWMLEQGAKPSLPVKVTFQAPNPG
ncbi:MAG TPA: hypothetical protein VGD76_20765 [Ramlibacter sp.]